MGGRVVQVYNEPKVAMPDTADSYAVIRTENVSWDVARQTAKSAFDTDWKQVLGKF